jgi:predicted thioredoxin/glutaredoxin
VPLHIPQSVPVSKNSHVRVRIRERERDPNKWQIVNAVVEFLIMNYDSCFEAIAKERKEVRANLERVRIASL